MFKNLGKIITKSLVIGMFIGLGIFITFAADIINLNQTVETSSRITKDWFNVVNTNITSINSSITSIGTNITNITNKLVNIYSTGANVGVGTSTPTEKLEVSGNVKATSFIGNLTGNATSATNASNVPWTGVTGRPTNVTAFTNDAGYLSGITDNRVDTTGDNITGNFNVSGNVGIGTTTPTRKFHVMGDIYANGGWLRSSGNMGWYSETWGGGWFMSDTTRLRTYNSKSIWTNTGTLGSNGGLTVGYGGAVPPTGGALIAGPVGIGTSAPTATLDVAGSIRSTGHQFINNGSPSIYLQDTDNRSAMIHTNSNLFYILRGDGINSTTYTAVNGYRPLYLNLENNNAQFGGAVYAPGGFGVSSDSRLKKNIKKIQNPIEKIQKLNGYNFEWKENGKYDIGIIAQDVEKIFPEIVSENKNARGEAYKNVNYGALVAPLIEAIKEQQKEIDELEKRLKILESK